MTRVRRDESFAEDVNLRKSAVTNLNMIGTEIQLTAASSGVVPDDMFTVTQAVNDIGFGRFQIILSFIVGLCWMADSMEMMILSILPLALQCEWGINHYRQAFLTTIVFIGKGSLTKPKSKSQLQVSTGPKPNKHFESSQKLLKKREIKIISCLLTITYCIVLYISF